MEAVPIHYVRRQVLPVLSWLLVLWMAGVNPRAEGADPPRRPKPELLPHVFNAGFLKTSVTLVTWPAKALPKDNGPLIIGLLGHDPFKGRLAELLAGTSISNRKFNVAVVTNVQDISNCQVLFVPANEQELWKKWRLEPGAATAPVLTVGDGAGFLVSGGIIQLEPGKGEFYLNLGHSRAQQIQLARLARLAEKKFIEPNTGPDDEKIGK